MVSIYDRQNETAYEQLKYRLAINDLGSARSLLLWDQQTYMPRGAVAGRAEQVATLSRLSLEMLVNEATARLLDSVGEPAPSSEEGAPVRRVRQDYAKRAGAPIRPSSPSYFD
jgi:carboxypeptidase Taq